MFCAVFLPVCTSVWLLLLGCLHSFQTYSFLFLCSSLFLIFSYFSCCWFAASGAIIWCWRFFFSISISLHWNFGSYPFFSGVGVAIRWRFAHMQRMTMKLILHNFFLSSCDKGAKIHWNVYETALTLWIWCFCKCGPLVYIYTVVVVRFFWAMLKMRKPKPIEWKRVKWKAHCEHSSDEYEKKSSAKIENNGNNLWYVKSEKKTKQPSINFTVIYSFENCTEHT